MLKLISSPRYEGLLGGGSPFIYKMETWLRLAGIPYEIVQRCPTQIMADAPRGTVPYVEIDGEKLGDSHHIIAHLKELHNDPLDDARLTPEQHAQGHLIQELCEHEILYILGHDRWVAGDYKTYGEFFLAAMPEEARGQAIEEFQKFVEERTMGWKIGRFELEIIHEMLRKDLDVLTLCLGDGPWLFGDKPTTYDTAMFGQIASLVHFPLPNPSTLISREYPALVKYCDMVRDEFTKRDDLCTVVTD